ncbi:MAG: Ig domain-containing protein [Mycobacterium sp.]
MRAALASPDVGAFQVGVLILRVTTASLADGTVGVAYSQQLAAVNGTGDVDWSIEAGTLPAGLALDTETGAITGTPTAGGTSVLTFRATDSASPTPNTDDQVLSVTVNAAAVIDITTTTLPNGTVASAYSQTIAVTNAIGSVTWSLVSGSLPAGLSLNASTGEITGTPTTAGTSNFTARATDSANQDDQALSITVDEQVVPAAGDVDDFPLAAVAIATGMV